MSRKRGGVEIGVLAGVLLAGCATGSGPAGNAYGAGTQLADTDAPVVVKLCNPRGSSWQDIDCTPDDEKPEAGFDPTPEHGGGSPPPDGVDYVRAVQCGGLLWALESVSTRTTMLRNGPHNYKPHGRGLLSMAGLYREWAGARAREAGRAEPTDALILRDMAASRDDFLASAGKGAFEEKTEALEKAYPGDVSACQSTAAAADVGILIIMGG